MQNLKLRVFFSYLLSAMFLLSGISKLFPISAFELQIVSTKIADWSLAPYLSRIIILAELVIGINLLVWVNGRRLLFMLSALFLSGFSIYLVIIMIMFGNQANCGCFGQILPMTSLAALIKNLLLLIPIFVFLKKWNESDVSFLRPIIITFVVMVALFFVSPIPKYTSPSAVSHSVIIPDTTEVDVNRTQIATRTKDSSLVLQTPPPKYSLLKKSRSIFHEFTRFSTTSILPDTGIKIFALFSLDCEHCLAAAKQIAKVKNKITLPPIYGLLLGEEDQIPQFTKESGLSFPYLILPPEKFFPLLTQSPPRIVLLGNGNTLYDADGNSFSIDSLKHKLRIFR